MIKNNKNLFFLKETKNFFKKIVFLELFEMFFEAEEMYFSFVSLF